MKLFVFAAVALPLLVLAQSPQLTPIRPFQPPQLVGSQIPADALPNNYQVTLTITDKDSEPVELSVVVASTRFNTSLGEQGLTFSGTLNIEDPGGAIVAYALGWETRVPAGNNNVQFKSSTTQGTVRLNLGEEVQIIRAGTRIARLTIQKLETAKPK